MFQYFLDSDGMLNQSGYVLFVAIMILTFVLALVFVRKSATNRHMEARELVFCAAAIALAFVTSFVRLYTLPWGGSVTLCSMFFIVLIANWYGLKTGIMVGFSYGILQFIQEPYVLSIFQVCCDYIFAFAMLGLAGLFMRSQGGLIKGYILAVFARGVFHSLGGYLYWMDYMPESFPQSIKMLYPIVYNYSYLLIEAVLTLIIINLPPVKNALIQVKNLATSNPTH